MCIYSTYTLHLFLITAVDIHYDTCRHTHDIVLVAVFVSANIYHARIDTIDTPEDHRSDMYLPVLHTKSADILPALDMALVLDYIRTSDLTSLPCILLVENIPLMICARIPAEDTDMDIPHLVAGIPHLVYHRRHLVGSAP